MPSLTIFRGMTGAWWTDHKVLAVGSDPGRHRFGDFVGSKVGD
jgi:hypothetical protein